MGKQLTIDDALTLAATGRGPAPSKPVPQFNPEVIASIKKGAAFARGQSKQDYATPRVLLDAIKLKFEVKAWAWDLAANWKNQVGPEGRFYGPDHPKVSLRDSLVLDWSELRGDLWLNPPFSNIAPWAKKCFDTAGWPYNLRAHTFEPPRRIFFLVPAAVGSNWWKAYVHRKARVYFLNGRPSFDGKNGYPKDIALVMWGEKPGYQCWRWRDASQRQP